MKIRNPKSRYDLKIKRNQKVIEIGGGHNPHSRSNVVVDKFIDSNYHRHSDIKVLKHQKFIQADGENLPFKDKSFDYAICNQVLEHVESPDAFLNEQMRVAKKGYLETPSLIGEYLFPKKAHKWLILELDNKLVLIDKEKYWFNTGIDFGFLFLTWLPKISLSWKILMKTKPDLFTVRYEWENTIDFVVNPDKEDIIKYFKDSWTEEMVIRLFPKKNLLAEVFHTFRMIFGITFNVLLNMVKRHS